MKPGPGVSELWGASGKGASALRRPERPPLGRGLPGTNMRRAEETPALPARGREGRV